MIEVLIATAIFVTSSVSALPLVFWSVSAVRIARDASMASRAAWQKAEELVATVPDPAFSPAAALLADTAGFFDRLDERGRASPAGLYTRRWLVAPLNGQPDTPLRIVVTVHPVSSPGRLTTIATLRRPMP